MSTWLLTLLCQLCLLHPRSCLLLLACLPMLIALAQSSGRSRLGEQEEGPHQRGALLSGWLVLLCCKPHLEGYLFCIIIIICSNCLNCLFKKEGIHRTINAVCGITWGLHIRSSPVHLLFRILIQACLFHNSELLFLYYYYFYPLPSFFLCTLLALCNRCGDLIPLPLKSIAKFLLTSLRMRASLSGEWGLELSRSK